MVVDGGLGLLQLLGQLADGHHRFLFDDRLELLFVERGWSSAPRLVLHVEVASLEASEPLFYRPQADRPRAVHVVHLLVGILRARSLVEEVKKSVAVGEREHLVRI
jgi:hypothetical protein